MTNVETKFYSTLRPFPDVIDNKINVVQFLDSFMDLLTLIERLGKSFAPVKYDIQGNINKIKNGYKFDDDSCLLQLMLNEIEQGETNVALGILWLNRALLLLELLFQEIINHIREKDYDVKMDVIYTQAYENSIKQYHGWVIRKLFILICKMAPKLNDLLMTSLEFENYEIAETVLLRLMESLRPVRSSLDSFFEDHKLFVN